MSYREYSYVGPELFLDLAMKNPSTGCAIQTFDQLIHWLKAQSPDRLSDESVVATFVLSTGMKLRLAPRRSEHIACARGEPVLSAGEMTFSERGELVEVSNQSTGFCPEPASWRVLEQALDTIPIRHPGKFTTKIIFRRCPSCLQRNIVKDDWLFCELCGSELPETWNFGRCGTS